MMYFNASPSNMTSNSATASGVDAEMHVCASISWIGVCVDAEALHPTNNGKIKIGYTNTLDGSCLSTLIVLSTSIRYWASLFFLFDLLS